MNSTEDRADKINATKQVFALQVGHKRAEDEMLYRFITVRGNDSLGYIAGSEEWFTAADKILPEFYDTQFETSIYDSAKKALHDAIPNAIQEAEAAGFNLDVDTSGWEIASIPNCRPAKTTIVAVERKIQKEPEVATPTLNPADYQITDGYVGQLGETYKTATKETLNAAIEAAAARNGKTKAEIVDLLAAGNRVEWCDSPNHYYDHSTGTISKKKASTPVQLVKCDCGHSVPASQRMSASLGSSCPDCYDRMSD